MDNPKEKLHDVIEKLIAAHEDAAELRYWESIFDDLSEKEQEAVLSNLEEELAAVK